MAVSSESVASLDESTPIIRKPQGDEVKQWSVKYTLALLGFVGILLEYCQRVCLSVVIVTMVAPGNGSQLLNQTNITCDDDEDLYKKVTGKLCWDKYTQGIILSAFFWGYACSNFVGGRAAEYLGSKRVFGFGILASSLFTLIGPITAKSWVAVFITCRIILGLFQGLTFPSMSCMLATWILPIDRSKYTTIVFSGFQIGTVLGFTLSGWLCSFRSLGGWPIPFYLFGTLGVLWSIIWYFLIYERPEDHPRISLPELWQLVDHARSVKTAKKIAVPWKSVFTSLPVWAIIVSAIGNDYGFYTLLTEMPTFLHDVQNFDITKNGFISSVPYFLMWLFGLLWAALMTWLSHKEKISILSIRRISMAVGLYGPMLGFVGLFLLSNNSVGAVAILCTFAMLNGALNSGGMCSPQDIAPNFAGTIFGIANTFGAISGIAAPSISGTILEDQVELRDWRIIFLISICVYFICCTFFIVFISADVQLWNYPPDHREEGMSFREEDNIPPYDARSTTGYDAI